MSEQDIAQKVEERFRARVDRTSTPNGCWPWTGALNKEGRGRFTVAGKTRYAYVYALEFSGVSVPDGQPVRHICGNPSCCRPDHLDAMGGQRENNLDTVEQGRHRGAKLNAPAVRRMRHEYANDRRPVEQLAREHGVSASAVAAALTGKTWSRAGGPLRPSRKRSE